MKGTPKRAGCLLQQCILFSSPHVCHQHMQSIASSNALGLHPMRNFSLPCIHKWDAACMRTAAASGLGDRLLLGEHDRASKQKTQWLLFNGTIQALDGSAWRKTRRLNNMNKSGNKSHNRSAPLRVSEPPQDLQTPKVALLPQNWHHGTPPPPAPGTPVKAEESGCSQEQF